MIFSDAVPSFDLNEEIVTKMVHLGKCRAKAVEIIVDNKACTFSVSGDIVAAVVCRLFESYGDSVDADETPASRAMLQDAPIHLLIVHSVSSTGSLAFVWNVATRRSEECRLPISICNVFPLRCGVLLQSSQPAILPWFTWFHPLEEPQPVAEVNDVQDPEGRLVAPGHAQRLLGALDDGGRSALLLCGDSARGVLVPYLIVGSRAHGTIAAQPAHLAQSNAAQGSQMAGEENSIMQSPVTQVGKPLDAPGSGMSAATRRTVRFAAASSLPDPGSAASRRTQVRGTEQGQGRGMHEWDMEAIGEVSGINDPDDEDDDAIGVEDPPAGLHPVMHTSGGTMPGRTGHSEARFDPASADAFTQQLHYQASLREELNRPSPTGGSRRWSRGSYSGSGSAPGRSPMGIDAETRRSTGAGSAMNMSSKGILDVGPGPSSLDDSLSAPDSEAIARFAGIQPGLTSTRFVTASIVNSTRSRSLGDKIFTHRHTLLSQSEASTGRAAALPEWFPADLLVHDELSNGIFRSQRNSEPGSVQPLSALEAAVAGVLPAGSASPHISTEVPFVAGDAVYSARCGLAARHALNEAQETDLPVIQADMLLLALPDIVLPPTCTHTQLSVSLMRVAGRQLRVFVTCAHAEQAPIVLSMDVDIESTVQFVGGSLSSAEAAARAVSMTAPVVLPGVTAVLSLQPPPWLHSRVASPGSPTDICLVQHDGALHWLSNGQLVFAWPSKQTVTISTATPQCRAWWAPSIGSLCVGIDGPAIQGFLPFQVPLGSTAKRVAALAFDSTHAGTFMQILGSADTLGRRIAQMIVADTRGAVTSSLLVYVGGRTYRIVLHALSKLRAAAVGCAHQPSQLTLGDDGTLEIRVVGSVTTLVASHITDTALLALVYLADITRGKGTLLRPAPSTPTLPSNKSAPSTPITAMRAMQRMDLNQAGVEIHRAMPNPVTPITVKQDAPICSLDIDDAEALLQCCPPGLFDDVGVSDAIRARQLESGAIAQRVLQDLLSRVQAGRVAGASREQVAADVVACLSSAMNQRMLPTASSTWPKELVRLACACVQLISKSGAGAIPLQATLLTCAQRADMLFTFGAAAGSHALRLRKSMWCALLERLAGGGGVGVLTTHGMQGKPPTESGQSAAASAALVNAVLGIGDMAWGVGAGQDYDGLDALAAGTTVASIRFPSDARLRVVAAVLRACRPHRLPVERTAGMTDHDYIAMQQQVLFWHARRVAASAVGRGMATCFTVAPSCLDPVPVPLITVAALMQPGDLLMKLDVSAVSTVGVGIMDWPEFHNGCAAAMRILPPFQTEGQAAVGSDGKGTSQRRLQRAWLRLHRFTGIPPDLAAVTAVGSAAAVGASASATHNAVPPSGVASGVVPPNPALAGVYMALGMTGALAGASAGELLELLAMTHTCTTVGVLLGAAAGSRGTAETTLVKAVVLHVPAILPGASAELDLPPVVQATSLVALGLLHEATANRSMTEFLLKEAGRGPVLSDETVPLDREAYCACAGFALGLVNLGLGLSQGRESTGIGADAKVTDRLLRLMLGGKDSAISAFAKAKLAADPSRPSLSSEGDKININVTASGAVLALAMIYLRTGNGRIVAALAPPDALPMLDTIRPDTLLLRCACRVLVAWHEHDVDDANRVWDYAAMVSAWGDGAVAHCPGPVLLRCTWEHKRKSRLRAWMRAQVPVPVRRVMRRLYSKACAESAPGAAMFKLAQLMAMVEDEPDEANAAGEGAGGGNAKAGKKSATKIPSLSSGGAPFDTCDGPLEDFDLEQVKNAYCMCLAGACLGLGMRYAGTGDFIVRDELLTQAYILALLRDSSDKACFGRLASEVQSLSAMGSSAALASARTLFLELTRRDQLSPQEALEKVNNIIGIRSDTDPDAADLLSPWTEPFSGYPFVLSTDGKSVLPCAATEASADHASLSGKVVPPAANKGVFRPRNVTLPVAQALAPSRSHLEHALVSAICGAALTMSGTADVGVLRIIRAVRRRLDSHTGYGSFLGTGMAMGMVSLGAGRATLSRSNASIASLLAAFYPYWPHGTATNSYWPQALRNMWACAVDARCLDTLEVSPSAAHDGESITSARAATHMMPVRVRVEVQLKSANWCDQKVGRSFQACTPFLLPELHTIHAIRVLPTPPSPGRPGDAHASWEWQPYTLSVGSGGLHTHVLTSCLQAKPSGAAGSAEDLVHGAGGPPVDEPGHAVAPSRAPFPAMQPTLPGHKASGTAAVPEQEFAAVSPAQSAALSATRSAAARSPRAVSTQMGPDMGNTWASTLSGSTAPLDVSIASLDVSLEMMLQERAPQALREALPMRTARLPLDEDMAPSIEPAGGYTYGDNAEGHEVDELAPYTRRCMRTVVLCVQRMT